MVSPVVLTAIVMSLPEMLVIKCDFSFSTVAEVPTTD